MTDNELLLAISEMMDKKLSPIKEKMDEMDNRLKKVELNQENIILPRLQNIEACYTSTYERYAKGVEQLENNAQDIELMRKVLIEHSKKLQKIS